MTAGPTREFFDPVRFLSNPSSGRMGYALAEAAARRGDSVTLLSGPVNLRPPKRCRLVPVVSARDMYRAVLRRAARSDLILMCAAVSDWRPATRLRHKLKKGDRTLTVRLLSNPDILKELGRRKRPGQVLVGFAAETRDLMRQARLKLHRKNLDAIVANLVGRSRGFEGDRNSVLLITKDGRMEKITGATKKRIASRVLKAASSLFYKKISAPVGRSPGL